jgi:hypothetical protein
LKKFGNKFKILNDPYFIVYKYKPYIILVFFINDYLGQVKQWKQIRDC